MHAIIKQENTEIYPHDDEHITEDGNVISDEQLVGEEVARDPSKGAKSRQHPLCCVCYHYHLPIVQGGCHLD